MSSGEPEVILTEPQKRYLDIFAKLMQLPKRQLAQEVLSLASQLDVLQRNNVNPKSE